MFDFEESSIASVRLPLFPASILELLRKMADDAGKERGADALTALRWIAAAYAGRDSSAYILTTFFRNPFENKPTYFCKTEVIQGGFKEGEPGWRQAEKLALEIVCKRERRCIGTVVAASLKQDISQKIVVFQTEDWGA